MYTYGDRFYGLGLIEPAYKSIVYKLNIEESQANAIYQRGHSPVIAYVGDQLHQPSPQDIQTVLDNLVKLKSDRYLSFPYFVRVDTLESKETAITQNTLEYLRRNQTASHGIPEAFATGAGEATNRATLNNQQMMLEYTLTDIVKKTISTFKKYILKRLNEYNGFGGIPDIVWGDIGAKENETKINQIISATKNQVFSPEEAKEYLLKIMNLK